MSIWQSKLARLSFAASIPLALAGCESQSSADQQQQVSDFAERINKTTPAAVADGSQSAPSQSDAVKAATREGAADGPFEAGTGTDPASANCSAPKVAPFYGRKADQLTQDAIMAAVAPHTNVRFAEAGFEVEADASSDRLNIMLDVNGVIRDARCG